MAPSILLFTPIPAKNALNLAWDISINVQTYQPHFNVIDVSSNITYHVYISQSDFLSGQYVLDRLPTSTGSSVPLRNGSSYSVQLTAQYESLQPEQYVNSNWVSGIPSDVPGPCVLSPIYDLSSNSNPINAVISFVVGPDNGNSIDKVKIYLCDNTDPLNPITTSATFSDTYTPGVQYTQLISNASALGNLVPGNTYLVSMEAINEAGCGQLSNSITIIATYAPLVAQVSSVISGQNTSLVVNVQPQQGLTYPPTSVSIYTRPVGTTSWSSATDFSATDLYGNLITNGLTVSNLVNATAYQVAAVYTNSSGSGPAPADQTGPFLTGVPSSTQTLSNLGVTASSQPSGDSIVLTGTLTVGSILPVVVTANFYGSGGSPLGSVQTYTSNISGSFTLTCGLPYLTLLPGTTYSVQVQAKAVVPSGLAQYWVTPPLANGSIATPVYTLNGIVAVVPSPPIVTNVYSTTSSGKLGFQVQWTAPSFTGYVPLTGYIVRLLSSVDMSSVLTTVNVSADPSNGSLAETTYISIDPSGLVLNTNYYVAVLASNSVGNSGYYTNGPYLAINPILTQPSSVTLTQISDTMLKLSWGQYTFPNGINGVFEVYSYDEYGYSTLLTDPGLPPSATSYNYSIASSYPVPTQVILGVQAVGQAQSSPSTFYYSAITIQTKVLGQAPVVSYNNISEDNSGNSIVTFTVNNGNDNIVPNGILLFVVPSSSAPAGVNPVIIVNPNNSQKVVVYSISLGYPALLTNGQPSILISACNSIGSSYYQKNLSDST
jgi:hypothetical protein